MSIEKGQDWICMFHIWLRKPQSWMFQQRKSWLWALTAGPSQVSYEERGKRISSILSLLRRDNEGRWKQRFFQWWLNSVFFSNSYILLGTYKVRNEIETKRNETKRNETKSTKTKRNETKRNENNETKQKQKNKNNNNY
jgi:hypothetical protein